MLAASARLLGLLSLLSSRPSWTCAELARSLKVTDRTVRRDIARLRELGYSVDSEAGPWGGYRLRTAIAAHQRRRYGLSYDPDTEVLVTAGATEAIAAALLALLEPGDEVVALEPYYDSYAASIALAGGRRVPVTLRPHEGSFRLDLDELRAAVTDRTRLLLINTPHNPTGRPADLGDPPDAAHLVSRNIANGPYPLSATVRLPVPLDQALRLVPATIGTHRPDGPDATLVDIGGADADGLARCLLGLGTPLRVLAPDEVRAALVRRAREVARQNAGGSDAESAGEPVTRARPGP
ncbi:aminotransferase class I/II-fold pyridoxal phosphate-dependent enzyme [Streptomyces sp. LaBMicrA B280]|uniref:aminotransferase class I/II-fold pyridoxal phosphate-dependent enzyme n=1 Tax=Streptomyces sp. LaBMicrA B280 TaxID=3391001 RepID=UPI003BA7000C